MKGTDPCDYPTKAHTWGRAVGVLHPLLHAGLEVPLDIHGRGSGREVDIEHSLEKGDRRYFNHLVVDVLVGLLIPICDKVGFEKRAGPLGVELG